jgi:hypothetical protein
VLAVKMFYIKRIRVPFSPIKKTNEGLRIYTLLQNRYSRVKNSTKQRITPADDTGRWDLVQKCHKMGGLGKSTMFKSIFHILVTPLALWTDEPVVVDNFLQLLISTTAQCQ